MQTSLICAALLIKYPLVTATQTQLTYKRYDTILHETHKYRQTHDNGIYHASIASCSKNS